jgi:hypothetical protein
MGSITRSFANNIGSSGILTASAVTNTTIEDVTSFDNAASNATLVLLSTQTASASANISFTTGLDSTYDEYIFKFINIHPATNEAEFSFNLSTDAGSNYNVTKTTTVFRAFHFESGSASGLGYQTTHDLAQSTNFQRIGQQQGNNADASGCGSLTIFNPASTTFVKHFISRYVNHYTNSAPGELDNYTAGYGNTTSAVNAVQFKFDTGNIDDGIIKMYGVKKS